MHISTDRPTVGVILSFSSPVYQVIAQAGEIPIMPVGCLFFPPYDPIARVIVQQSMASSVVIPALAFQTGVITSDFFALVFSNSSSPLVSATASVISTSTSEYTPSNKEVSISVSSSTLPQIFRIPYHEDLQVVSTEVEYSDMSCLDSANFSEVLFLFIIIFSILYLFFSDLSSAFYLELEDCKPYHLVHPQLP